MAARIIEYGTKAKLIMNTQTLTPVSHYKQVATQLAYTAGTLIREKFGSVVSIRTKTDTSLVTEVDTQVNTIVLKTLRDTFPDIPVIAEEESSPPSKSYDLQWVCDPLDGTAVFAHGIPTCAFSLALTYKGESIVGVIYDPFLNRVYIGEKNTRTTLNGKPIHVSAEDELFNTMMGMSLWAGSKYDFLELIPQFKKAGIMPLNAFSTVYMGMLVASGQLSAAIYLDGHAHDVAALKVIVEGAGGKVTDLYGEDQRYDQPVRGCLISNGILHNAYLDLIRKANI